MPATTNGRANDAGDASDESRVLTVPNLISVVRLACIPLFLYLLFAKDDRARAAYLLGALGATDWVDGYIARHFHQVSNLGKVLDPTADRLLLGTALVAIIVDGAAPRWVAVAVLVREVLISIAALVLAGMGARRIDVTWVGKAGTFANLFAFPFLLAGASAITWHTTAHWLGWGFAIPGLVLSWYAAVTYVPLARRALDEGNKGNEGKAA